MSSSSIASPPSPLDSFDEDDQDFEEMDADEVKEMAHALMSGLDYYANMLHCTEVETYEFGGNEAYFVACENDHMKHCDRIPEEIDVSTLKWCPKMHVVDVSNVQVPYGYHLLAPSFDQPNSGKSFVVHRYTGKVHENGFAEYDEDSGIMSIYIVKCDGHYNE